MVSPKKANSRLYTFGWGQNGQLGHGGTLNECIPHLVPFKKEPVQVCCGSRHTVALMKSGDVWTWGKGDDGQLGHSSTDNELSPKKIVNDHMTTPISMIACRGPHVLALDTNGNVWSWGANVNGQLGLGFRSDSSMPYQNSPTLVSSLCDQNKKIVSIAAGRQFSAAITDAGELFTWGVNEDGQLGSGDGKNHSTPRKVKIPPVQTVSCGSRHMLCLTTSGGHVYSCGWNAYGQLGNGTREPCTKPKMVPLNFAAKQVHCGYRHSIIVTLDGSAYTFGWNVHGQLGLGSNEDNLSPKKVESLEGKVDDISAGGAHTFFLMDRFAKFRVMCCGKNEDGQLGIGAGAISVSTPVPHTAFEMDDLFNVSVGLGWGHSCVVVSFMPTSPRACLHETTLPPAGQKTIDKNPGFLRLARPQQVNKRQLMHRASLEEGAVSDTQSIADKTLQSVYQYVDDNEEFEEEEAHGFFGKAKALYKWCFGPGDLDAFFAFFMNGLLQLMVIRQLCPIMMGGGTEANEIVLYHILPAVGVAIAAGHFLFCYQAYTEGRKHGTTWTSQPHGINSLTLFPYLQLIIYPVFLDSGSAYDAWGAAVFANLISGLFELVICAPLAQNIRQLVPPAALLSALAGTALTFLTLNFVFQLFARPVTSLIPMAVVLLSLNAQIRWPGGVPGGFVSFILGIGLGWISGAFDLQPAPPPVTVDPLGFAFPTFNLDAILAGAAYYKQILAVVIPLEVLNLVNNMASLESADATGEVFDLRQSLTFDSFATIASALCGNPFPTSIFIGHPAFKKMGARQGYKVYFLFKRVFA